MLEDAAKQHIKKIAKELASFGACLEDTHKENPAKTRTLKSMEAPAYVLALDGLIQTMIDKLRSSALQYVDRDMLVREFLGYIIH